MDEMQENTPRPVNPRRRKKTKAEVFKETYLPAIIAGAALLFIIIAIIGSAVQSSQRKKQNAQLQQSTAAEAEKQKQQWDAECSALLKQAEDQANAYDYQQAITTLRSFSGSFSQISFRISNASPAEITYSASSSTSVWEIYTMDRQRQHRPQSGQL